MKEINVDSHSVPSTARSKNYRTAQATTASSGGGATTPSVAPTTGGAADTAKVAQNLAEDSTDWEKILRKDIDERTENALSIGKNLTVDGQAILNDVVANTGTFAGLLKATSATITGALLASTVSATTINATTFIGELQGNAATATKLKTARTIWGQSFDGSGNVDGRFVLGGTNSFTIEDMSTYKKIQTNTPLSINPSGSNVGIGNIAPAYKLDVSGDINSSTTIRATSGFAISGALTINNQSNYVRLESVAGPMVLNPGGNFVGIGTTTPQYKLDVNGNARISNLLSAANGGVFYGSPTLPTNVGSYVLNYVSPTYGPRVTAYDGTNYQKLSLGKLISGTTFQLELNADGTSKFNGGLISNGVESSKGGIFFGQNSVMPSGLGTYVANYTSDAYGARVLAFDGAAYKDLKLGAMPTSGVFGMSLMSNGDTRVGYNIGTSNFASRVSGWQVNAQGAADFRNIYADELRVQAFTADISQALAGSDYLTKSVSKLSANFIVPAVNSTVRIIVDDIEGMPATQCFSNNDYIRFRAFNRTSGLTIANVWGTVTLDTSFGTNGFTNGTQAYTFTCKATSGAGLTVFKGSEVLDYGTSGSGMIARTTLDAMGSPYEQIATWQSDPSVSTNYTVHARLGNLGGIANCNGYGVYTDNGFFTGKITVGDLTKTNHYLDFSGGALTVRGNILLASGYSAVSTLDMSNGISLAVNNIQVGGRNILTGTNNNYSCISSWGIWSINSDKYLYTNNNNYNELRFRSTDSTNNKKFVASFYASVATSGYRFVIADSAFSVSIFTKNINNGYNEFAFILPDGYNSFALDVFGTGLSSGECVISNLKLEIGTKATDYTPAPEDVDAAISLKVSKDGVVGAINLTSEAATIQASKINLLGAVTFSSFDSSTQNTINGKADSAAHGNFTYIDGNSVYTGTLTANQVNAVGISASSITTGTLAADRIAANSITFGKLVGTDITALGNVTAGSFNIGSGKYVVDANGNLTAASATVTGNITATAGSIGRFAISVLGELTSTRNTNSLLLDANLISFAGTNKVARIGDSILSGSLAGLNASGRFDNTRQVIGSGNVGVYIDVSGSRVIDDSTSFEGNHALYIEHGCITGFRTRQRRCNASQTLSVHDTTIIDVSTSTDATYTLPVPQDDGQRIEFVTTSRYIRVSPNSGSTLQYGTDPHLYTSSEYATVLNGNYAVCIYDAVNSTWLMRDFRETV